MENDNCQRDVKNRTLKILPQKHECISRSQHLTTVDPFLKAVAL